MANFGVDGVREYLVRMKGKFLGFCKYNKQRIKRTPRFLLTQRLKLLLKKGENLNLPAAEVRKMQKFLRWHLMEVFNDPFIHSYEFRRYKMLRDKEKGLWFVYTSDGKRLYFKRGMTRKEAHQAHRFLEKEQDGRSPHCYFFNGLNLSENSVVADIGAAEGNFGLKIVDRIKELYLFECDPEWIEALEATFEPWKNKVHIVNRYVSDNTSSDTVRLDEFFKDKDIPDVLKMDVEGAEASVLEGSSDFLKAGRISELLVCTYHKKEDAEELPAILSQFGYTSVFSQGYMFFFGGEDLASRFRKGLIHATKN